jgi:hypothetical protein
MLSNVFSKLDSVMYEALFAALLLFQFRKRERWLWSGILSVISARLAVNGFSRPGGGSRLMFGIGVCFCVSFAITAVVESIRAWRNHRAGRLSSSDQPAS